ncbi:hypothetical protein CPB85DRAFT_1549283 [Mucidula mucida]|nr:hypothetical protein CPB85DRAFT_1549283 [Mucidula mucida]
MLQQASGISVNPACIEAYQSLKLGKRFKYIIYRISDDVHEIIAECRWAVYDLEYTSDDGGKRNKLIFFAWSPDDAKVSNKMLSASSKETLKRALAGISVEVQGTEFGEVAYAVVIEKVTRAR